MKSVHSIRPSSRAPSVIGRPVEVLDPEIRRELLVQATPGSFLCADPNRRHLEPLAPNLVRLYTVTTNAMRNLGPASLVFPHGPSWGAPLGIVIVSPFRRPTDESDQCLRHGPRRLIMGGNRRNHTLRLIWLKFCIAFLLAFAASLPVRAQVSTADLVGTVLDPGGAVVPGAKVTLTQLDRQDIRTVNTNDVGEFTFALLQNGTYSISIDATGFKRYEVSGIVLSGGDRRRVNATLPLQSSTQEVQVNTAPPALETDTTALSTVVNQRQVEELPLNGRNFVQLAQLAAGSNEGTASAISNGNRPDDRRQTSSVVANAQSDTLNNEMVEGVDNNEGTVGTIGVRPSVEAIAEFRVLTNLYPAEVGKTAGAVVNLITRAGTNAFHGSAYEFLRNDYFDAPQLFRHPCRPSEETRVPAEPVWRQHRRPHLSR